MTRSPITMSSLPSRLNAAHEVSPIGGDIFTPAMVTARSLRGTDTLNTPSFWSSAPLAPVRRSIAAVSIAFSAAFSIGAPHVARVSVARTMDAALALIFRVHIDVSPEDRLAGASLAGDLRLAMRVERVVDGKLAAHVVEIV